MPFSAYKTIDSVVKEFQITYTQSNFILETEFPIPDFCPSSFSSYSAGPKYTLLKAEEKLSVEQKEKLEQVKSASPNVGIMHSLKEEFHQIFESSKDLGSGTLDLVDWLKKAGPYYRKSVPTIKRCLGEIVGYFEQRTTSGIVEGINNKLKLLKRCGCGFRNFHNFQLRALLFWHLPEILAH